MMREIRSADFDGYIFCKTIVNEFGMGKKLTCYCDPATKEVIFFVHAIGYSSPCYNTLEEAIAAFNVYDDRQHRTANQRGK